MLSVLSVCTRIKTGNLDMLPVLSACSKNKMLSSAHCTARNIILKQGLERLHAKTLCAFFPFFFSSLSWPSKDLGKGATFKEFRERWNTGDYVTGCDTSRCF